MCTYRVFVCAVQACVCWVHISIHTQQCHVCLAGRQLQIRTYTVCVRLAVNISYTMVSCVSGRQTTPNKDIHCPCASGSEHLIHNSVMWVWQADNSKYGYAVSCASWKVNISIHTYHTHEYQDLMCIQLNTGFYPSVCVCVCESRKSCS